MSTFTFDTDQAWQVNDLRRDPIDIDSEAHLQRAPSGTTTPAQLAARLQEHGYQAQRCAGGWLAQCPCHHDQHPSLRISSGHSQPLVLKCFGCPASFQEILRAVGLWKPETTPNTSSVLHAYRCLYCLDPLHNDLGVITQINWITSDSKKDDLHTGQIGLIELPKRAGRVMRLVAEDMVTQVNLRRILDRNHQPLAYGCDQASRELGVHRANIRRALHKLEHHGAIECVDQLPPRGRGLDGAKLYALRIAVACSACRSVKLGV